MPLIRQIPKIRGFKSIYPKSQALSLAKIAKVFEEDQEINPKVLLEKGIIKTLAIPVKILGRATFQKRLRFKNIQFSATAKVAVERSGGTTNA